MTALLNFVADGNLPFSVIQQPSFVELITLVAGRNVDLPRTGVFMTFLKDQFDVMKNKLRELLAKQEFLCITCDVWSSHAQSYLGMTVHFIDDSLERQSFILAFRELKHKQTNKELAKEIAKVLRDYGIVTTKITNIVTDGGSAFCKAFKVFGKGSDSLAEPGNSIVANVENDDDDDNDNQDDIPFIQYDDGEYFASNIILFDENESTGFQHLDDDMDLEPEDGISQQNEPESLNALFADDTDFNQREEEPEIQLPPHRRCISHYFNLIDNDFEKEISGITKSALMVTMNKLQALWVYPRRSSQANSICKEILGCKLKLSCETRWNSKFDAINQIHQIGKDKINDYIVALQNSPKKAVNLQRITDEDWIVITGYIKVMQHVAASLDILQGEKNCGQGFILPTIANLKNRIKELDGGLLLKHFKEAMLKVIDRRFSKYYRIDSTTRDLVLASLTTPRLKNAFIQDEDDWDVARNFLVSECIKISTKEQSASDATETALDNQNDDYFQVLIPRSMNRRDSVDQNVQAEVSKFLNDDRKAITILHEYPTIKKIYIKYNTTLCSSGAVERLFSQSSLIFTPRRNRILATNFEYILLLKHNRNLLMNQ